MRFIMKLCDGSMLCDVRGWPNTASEAESLGDEQVLGNLNHFIMWDSRVQNHKNVGHFQSTSAHDSF